MILRFLCDILVFYNLSEIGKSNCTQKFHLLVLFLRWILVVVLVSNIVFKSHVDISLFYTDMCRMFLHWKHLVQCTLESFRVLPCLTCFMSVLLNYSEFLVLPLINFLEQICGPHTDGLDCIIRIWSHLKTCRFIKCLFVCLNHKF